VVEEDMEWSRMKEKEEEENEDRFFFQQAKLPTLEVLHI
jgi:hypothetical protein